MIADFCDCGLTIEIVDWRFGLRIDDLGLQIAD